MVNQPQPTASGSSYDGKIHLPRIAVVDMNGNYVNAIARGWQKQFGCELVPITFGQPSDFKPYSGNENAPTVMHLGSLEEVKHYLSDPANKIDGVLTGMRIGKNEYGKELLRHLAVEGFDGFAAIQHAEERSELAKGNVFSKFVIGAFDRDEVLNPSETNGVYKSGIGALAAKISARERGIQH